MGDLYQITCRIVGHLPAPGFGAALQFHNGGRQVVGIVRPAGGIGGAALCGIETLGAGGVRGGGFDPLDQIAFVIVAVARDEIRLGLLGGQVPLAQPLPADDGFCLAQRRGSGGALVAYGVEIVACPLLPQKVNRV